MHERMRCQNSATKTAPCMHGRGMWYAAQRCVGLVTDPLTTYTPFVFLSTVLYCTAEHCLGRAVLQLSPFGAHKFACACHCLMPCMYVWSMARLVSRALVELRCMHAWLLAAAHRAKQRGEAEGGKTWGIRYGIHAMPCHDGRLRPSAPAPVAAVTHAGVGK